MDYQTRVEGLGEWVIVLDLRGGTVQTPAALNWIAIERVRVMQNAALS